MLQPQGETGARPLPAGGGPQNPWCPSTVETSPQLCPHQRTVSPAPLRPKAPLGEGRRSRGSGHPSQSDPTLTSHVPTCFQTRPIHRSRRLQEGGGGARGGSAASGPETAGRTRSPRARPRGGNVTWRVSMFRVLEYFFFAEKRLFSMLTSVFCVIRSTQNSSCLLSFHKYDSVVELGKSHELQGTFTAQLNFIETPLRSFGFCFLVNHLGRSLDLATKNSLARAVIVCLKRRRERGTEGPRWPLHAPDVLSAEDTALEAQGGFLIKRFSQNHKLAGSARAAREISTTTKPGRGECSESPRRRLRRAPLLSSTFAGANTLPQTLKRRIK